MRKYLLFHLLYFLSLLTFAQESFSTKIDSVEIKYVKNNIKNIIKPSDSLPFYFDPVTNVDYQYLYDSIVLPQMTEKWGANWIKENTWVKVRKLRIWTREYLDNGGWNTGNVWTGVYDKELYNIREIVTHKANNGDGLCSYYATFFMHVCLSVGINNRRVGWWRPNGDQLNEVYIPEKQKWIAMSPLYNAWFSDIHGPLSLTEINYYKHAGQLERVKTERDFQTTYPNPEIRKNWLAHYSWDIYFWNKNGYLLKKSPKGYRYFNKTYWPYNHFEAKYITKESSNIEDINFDASLISSNITVEKNTILLNILDYSVINFLEFRYEIFSIENQRIFSGAFTSNSKEINFESFEKTNYKIELYAVNNREGKSQVIEIGVRVH